MKSLIPKALMAHKVTQSLPGENKWKVLDSPALVLECNLTWCSHGFHPVLPSFKLLTDEPRVLYAVSLAKPPHRIFT